MPSLDLSGGACNYRRAKRISAQSPPHENTHWPGDPLPRRFGVHGSRPALPMQALSAHRSQFLPRRFPRFPAKHVFEESGNQGGPACLMARAHASPGVAVEVFIEEDEVASSRIRRVTPIVAVARAPTRRVGQEDAGQTAADLAGHLLQVQHLTGTGRGLRVPPSLRAGRLPQCAV